MKECFKFFLAELLLISDEKSELIENNLMVGSPENV